MDRLVIPARIKDSNARKAPRCSKPAMEGLLIDPWFSVPLDHGQPANVRLHTVVGGKQVTVLCKHFRSRKDYPLEEEMPASVNTTARY